MSLEAMIEGFSHAPRLKPRARVVYNVLANEVRPPQKCPRWVPAPFRGRVCWPGEGLLAKQSGYSERTVRRALDELREAAVIRSQPRMRQDGRGRRSDIHELFGPAFLPDDQWADLGRLVRGRPTGQDGQNQPDKTGRNPGDQPAKVAPEPSSREPRNGEPQIARARGRGSGNGGGPRKLSAAHLLTQDGAIT